MSGIPEGHVLIEVTISEDGSYKEEIVGHGPNSSCTTEDDDQLLQDLFGDLGEDDDWGKTREGYEATRVKTNQKPYTDTPFKDTPTAVEEDQKSDLGFGV
jgi:hypothetical protein